MERLPAAWYLTRDVLALARDLLGKVLVTSFPEGTAKAIITETEAYDGVHDRASHAWGGRCTPRTEVMFREGGVAYIYLCYGIHSLFNVVSGPAGLPQAVLIRSVEPMEGLDLMLRRLGKGSYRTGMTRGPGRVGKAMGLHYLHSGASLTGELIWLEDRGISVPRKEIMATPRIGVAYAGEDAHLPYRFVWNKNT